MCMATRSAFIMPWTSFAKLSESDVRSVHRYLKTLTPVHAPSTVMQRLRVCGVSVCSVVMRGNAM